MWSELLCSFRLMMADHEQIHRTAKNEERRQQQQQQQVMMMTT
jgi:hypothetical protein